MVRLGGADYRGGNNQSEVSIPVWFDWEFWPLKSSITFIEFQFQYGSIGRFLAESVVHRLKCFNSSMVRLGDSFRANVPECLPVSIPVWFDWEFRQFL